MMKNIMKCGCRNVWFDDFVNVLNENSYYVIPFSTVSGTGGRIMIQTANKLFLTLIYEGSKIEFHK